MQRPQTLLPPPSSSDFRVVVQSKTPVPNPPSPTPRSPPPPDPHIFFGVSVCQEGGPSRHGHGAHGREAAEAEPGKPSLRGTRGSGVRCVRFGFIQLGSFHPVWLHPSSIGVIFGFLESKGVDFHTFVEMSMHVSCPFGVDFTTGNTVCAFCQIFPLLDSKGVDLTSGHIACLCSMWLQKLPFASDCLVLLFFVVWFSMVWSALEKSIILSMVLPACWVWKPSVSLLDIVFFSRGLNLMEATGSWKPGAF